MVFMGCMHSIHEWEKRIGEKNTQRPRYFNAQKPLYLLIKFISSLSTLSTNIYKDSFLY